MGFSNSPLVNYTKISPNKNVNRNHKIDTITIHCVVGQCSVETIGNVFAPKSRQASSNYGIGPVKHQLTMVLVMMVRLVCMLKRRIVLGALLQLLTIIVL